MDGVGEFFEGVGKFIGDGLKGTQIPGLGQFLEANAGTIIIIAIIFIVLYMLYKKFRSA